MNIEEYISSGILESYVLGFTTESENALISCLIKTNPTIAEEVRAIQETIELAANQYKIAPPEDLKANIWNTIQQDEKVTKVETPIIELKSNAFTEQNSISKPRSYNWLNVAASTILILTSTVFAFYFYFQNKEVNNQMADLKKISEKLEKQDKTNQSYLAFLASKETEKITLTGVAQKPNAKAVLFWNKANKHVMLSEITLPKAPEKMQYQLWALVDGKPIDAGMLDLNPEGKLLEMKVIENSQAFAITLEPMGGSTSPHLEDLCVIGNVK